jgi:hypothetical protein
MRNKLVRDLARVASKDYQLEHIVNATGDSYVLPEEVLNNLAQTLRTLLAHPELRRALSSRERDAAQRCLEEIESASIPFDDRSVSNEELIMRDEAWSAVRAAATRFLILLEANLSDLRTLASD